MAGMVGAGTGAVLTAVVMIAEMTADFKVLMPLIVTVAVAFGVRRMITGETIYTLKLTRRGHLIPETRTSNLYLLRQAREFMRKPFLRIGVNATAEDLRRQIPPLGPRPHVLLTDEDRIAGVIPQHEVDRLLREASLSPERSLRALAEISFEILPDRSTVMDVVARRLNTEGSIFVFTESGNESAREVTGIVTWVNLVHEASLPPVLSARMGRRSKPTTAQKTPIPNNGEVADLEVDPG